MLAFDLRDAPACSWNVSEGRGQEATERARESVEGEIVVSADTADAKKTTAPMAKERRILTHVGIA